MTRVASRTLVTDLKAVEALQPDWDRLLAAGGGTPFQSHDWVVSWLEAFADETEPLVITVPGDQGLDAILPLCRRGRGSLTFAGHPQNDYGGWVADPGRSGALEKLAEALAALGGRGLLLDQLPERHPAWRGLIEPLARTRAVWSLAPADLCPAMLLEDPAAARDLYSKRRVANWTNWFERRGRLVFRVEEDAERSGALLETLFAQHMRRWDGTDTPSAFRDPRMQAFYRAFVARMMPKGLVRIAVLSLDDAPVALLLFLCRDGVYHLYKSAYDVAYHNRSPGQVLLRCLLEHALEESAREMDFTRGGEGYKHRYCNLVRRNHRLVLYPDRPRKWAAEARRRLAASRVVRRIRGASQQ